QVLPPCVIQPCEPSGDETNVLNSSSNRSVIPAVLRLMQLPPYLPSSRGLVADGIGQGTTLQIALSQRLSKDKSVASEVGMWSAHIRAVVVIEWSRHFDCSPDLSRVVVMGLFGALTLRQAKGPVFMSIGDDSNGIRHSSKRT